ncbi:MAG: MiaB/RimO family radical SAM methylthiotransferase [Candidatus Omnitrophota bacterium]|nr:MAG: MiaB/RimO family radical SAM methylthiotransferase [Candidatus Omnitrophota bacterium]
MNIRDSEVISGLLRAMNYELITDSDTADVILFNTCSVRQHAEDKVWSEIGRISKRTTHDAQRTTKRPLIGVIGCMAQTYKDEIFKRAPVVDFVVGPSDIAKIPTIITELDNAQRSTHNALILERKIWETDGQARPEEIYRSGFYEDKNHAYVVISEGCSNFCSYCVVPYARGPLRNREYMDILDEIKLALEKGITTITLLGQNVNAYVDKDVSFVKLVELVNSVKGLKEFSFVTSHPKDTSIDLCKAMAKLDKLKKYLHLPVQSGSDKILKLMNRGYTKKDYLDLIENYRTIVKGGKLTTDIMVGFPSETEVDFKDVYDLVKRAQFDAAYIFKYSPRPHTQASQWPDDVTKEEKGRRHSMILDLQREISRNKGKRKKATQ